MLKHVCIALVLTLVAAYPNYRELIPNGMNVPDPCNADGVWAGVGHLSLNGGGPRNPFGEDFAAEGHVWSKVLCEKDSDGDGKSNGEELGDPQCTFTPISFDQVGPPTGHPGVCEPVGSDSCGDFACPA